MLEANDIKNIVLPCPLCTGGKAEDSLQLSRC